MILYYRTSHDKNGRACHIPQRVKHAVLPISAALLALTAGLTHADDIGNAATTFVKADGFEITSDIAALANRLDAQLIDTGKPRKDANITAVEKAILLLDMYERFTPRARYMARIGMERHDGIPVSLVEVERYNLGPVIWKETAEAYGKQNTAPIEDFGVGPHVIWRIATQPNSTAAATLLAASRREVANDDAAGRTCIAHACLSLEPIAFITKWEEARAFDLKIPALAYGPRLADKGDDSAHDSKGSPFAGEQPTALLALQLSAAGGLAAINASEVRWTAEPVQEPGGDAPVVEFLIERNLGQEIASEGVLRITQPGGSSQDRWIRIATHAPEDASPPILWSAHGELKPVAPGKE